VNVRPLLHGGLLFSITRKSKPERDGNLPSPTALARQFPVTSRQFAASDQRLDAAKLASPVKSYAADIT
jgi:hypothetical protein